MGIIGWIIYFVLGLLLFVIVEVLASKYELTKLNRLILSLIIMMIFAGMFMRLGIPYTDDIFLMLVFSMIVDVIYHSYFLGVDFFDKSENNVKYYILLVLCGLFINYEFIDEVTEVFLTGEDLRVILWFFAIVFAYNIFKDKNILSGKVSIENKKTNPEFVLIKYAKLKYRYSDDVKYDNKDLVNVLYALMIFYDKKRSNLLRRYDNFIFKINGNSRKLGIMQVESKKFISDVESIELAYKKLVKLSEKKNSKEKVSIDDIMKKYDEKNYEDIRSIYNIISKI